MKWSRSVLCLLLLPFVPQRCSTHAATSGEKMELEATLKSEYVHVLATAPDNETWAAAGTYETLVFKGKRLIATLPMSLRDPELRFRADGNTLLGGGLEGNVSAKEVKPSAMLKHFGQQFVMASTYYPAGGDTAIVFVRSLIPKTLDKSPTEQQPNRLVVMDAQRGAELRELGRGFDLDEDVRMAVHRDWVATGSEQLRVWNWHTGKLVFSSPLENGIPSQRIAFSPDGRYLAAVARHEGTGTIWDTGNWQQVWKGSLMEGGVNQITFSPVGNLLLVAGKAGGVSAWVLDAAGKPVSKPLSIPGMVEDIAFSPDGKRLYVAGDDQTRIYRVE